MSEAKDGGHPGQEMLEHSEGDQIEEEAEEDEDLSALIENPLVDQNPSLSTEAFQKPDYAGQSESPYQNDPTSDARTDRGNDLVNAQSEDKEAVRVVPDKEDNCLLVKQEIKGEGDENTANAEGSNQSVAFDPFLEGEGSGSEEEQAEFMKELEKFHIEHNLEFKPPKFYGEGLNCLKLWRQVTRLGGYDQVTSCKLWRQVGEAFRPPKLFMDGKTLAACASLISVPIMQRIRCASGYDAQASYSVSARNVLITNVHKGHALQYLGHFEYFMRRFSWASCICGPRQSFSFFIGETDKALFEYEKHKIRTGQLQVPVSSVPEPMVVDHQAGGNQSSGSGRARRDAAARAMQGWHSQRLLSNGEVGEPIIKDKSSLPLPKRDRSGKKIAALKKKKATSAERTAKVNHANIIRSQSDSMIVDVGAPADWVKINVRKTNDCYEVYALVPGLLREEVHVQSDPAGRLVISGNPEQPDNPWGVTAFKKVITLPSRIDPHQTSAVVTLHGQLFVRAPFERSDI